MTGAEARIISPWDTPRKGVVVVVDILNCFDSLSLPFAKCCDYLSEDRSKTLGSLMLSLLHFLPLLLIFLIFADKNKGTQWVFPCNSVAVGYCPKNMGCHTALLCILLFLPHDTKEVKVAGPGAYWKSVHLTQQDFTILRIAANVTQHNIAPAQSVADML